MSERDDHPVWGVYDLYRTMRLSCCYYSLRLKRFQRANFWMELGLAITASGSAVASLDFFKSETGIQVWQVLVSMAAVIAILKPLLRLSEKIAEAEKRAATYFALEIDLKQLKEAIEEQRCYTEAHRIRFAEIRKKENEIALSNFDPYPDKALRASCEKEVNDALPSSHFYRPPENCDGSAV